MDNQTDTTNPETENETETTSTPDVVTEPVMEELPDGRIEKELPAMIEETVEEENTDIKQEQSSSGTQAMSRLDLEAMIIRYLDEYEKTKSQYRTQKDMYDSAFENDAEYMQKSKEADELKKGVAAIKQRIVKDPSVIEASNRMKGLKDDMKDIQDAISRYAEQYVTVAQTTELMREDGEVLQIIKNFKLVKQKKA